MAEYSLNDVKKAAKQFNIEYRGRKVQIDIANLGYELKDIADCLCNLSENDFQKTHYRKNNIPPDDAYICNFSKITDDTMQTDRLYIKFSLIDNSLLVELASFHLPQY